MSNKIIPNSFQHPNWYEDTLAYFLTPQEQVVLNKAIREILGWYNKIEGRKARIALSVFVDGKFNKETGDRLCYGCGIGLSAVRKAINALCRFKILDKVGDPTNDGQLYYLQPDADKIDMVALELRKEQQSAKHRERTSKAREVLSDNGGTVGQTPGVLCDSREGVLSDNNKETQRNPIETQHVASDAPTTILTEEIPSPGQELTGDELLDAFELGQTPRQKVKPSKPFLEVMAEPYAQWGRQSEEFQRQLARFGVRGRRVQELGWNLEQKFGIRPLWSKPKLVKGWMAGLSDCLELAENDTQLVLDVARGMREEKLTIKNPYSLHGMIDDAMAKKRSPTPISQAVETYR